MTLKVLVDKEISDITPKEFFKLHSKFSISMKYTQEFMEDLTLDISKKPRTICLDALDDDENTI